MYAQMCSTREKVRVPRGWGKRVLLVRIPLGSSFEQTWSLGCCAKLGMGGGKSRSLQVGWEGVQLLNRR